jgi:hypothetical protein
MSLTLYSLHLVALHLELGPPRDTVDLYGWHVAAAALFGAAWRTTLGRGPLERFTRMCSQTARNTVLLLSR